MKSLQPASHFVRFSITPACVDDLSARKTIQDALLQAFGLTSANLYIDLLWLAEDGTEAVIRVNQSEVRKVIAACTAFTGSPKLFLLKESPFLPALLSTDSAPRGP